MRTLLASISMCLLVGCTTTVYNRSVVHVTDQKAETYGRIQDTQTHGGDSVAADKRNDISTSSKGEEK